MESDEDHDEDKEERAQYRRDIKQRYEAQDDLGRENSRGL